MSDRPMHAIPRRLALLALGALLLSGTACRKDDVGGPPGPVAGTYTLRTVNAQMLPVTVYDGNELGTPFKVEVLAGSIVLDASGTYDDVVTIHETAETGPRTPREIVATGTYTRAGSTLTLTDRNSFDTSTITVQRDGSLVRSGDYLAAPLTTVRYVKQ